MAKVLLNGKCVHLRGLVEADREQLHAWRSSPELKRLTGPGPFVPVPLDAVVIDDTERTIQFAICRNDTSLLIGWIALTNIFWSNQGAELSVYIANQSERGSGYGSDAISELLRYGFDELNLHRIELEVVAYNANAIKVYENLGFVPEGTKREFGERDGERYDLLQFGILATEYRMRLNQTPS